MTARRRARIVPLAARRGSDSDPYPNATNDPEATSDGDDQLVQEAASLFSRHYGRAVSDDEARRMSARMTTFFGLLAEWERRRRELERAA